MSATAVIIGAGPGGAAAAVRMAQRGVGRVILVDKDRFPRDKTCGSALSPNGLGVCDTLGLGDEVRRRGYPIGSLRVTTPGCRLMHMTTQLGTSVILQRKQLDQLLVERARALGVEFVDGFRVTEVVRSAGRAVAVRGRDGNGSRQIDADFVLAADGAHSLFSLDRRPKRTISTLMGWWEGMPFVPHSIEMIFDARLAPLYGWMFPESETRVNIGICMDGEGPDGRKTERNVRDLFARFVEDHFRDRLRDARQIGKLKGHPISYTTWIRDCTGPGLLLLGEAARITHNATGEGIYQAMQSGLYAADAIADVAVGGLSERRAWAKYRWRCRQRFTAGFVAGHAVRGLLKTPLLDAMALAYDSPWVRRLATTLIGSTLAGSPLQERDGAMDEPTPEVPIVDDEWQRWAN